MKAHEAPTLVYIYDRAGTSVKMITNIEQAAAKVLKHEMDEGITEEMKQIWFAKVDHEHNKMISQRLKVQYLPTMVLIRNGQVLDEKYSFNGNILNPNDIADWTIKNARETIRPTELDVLQETLESPNTNFTQYVYLLDLKQSNDREILEYAKKGLPKMINSITGKADVWGVYDTMYIDDTLFDESGKKLGIKESSLVAFYPVRYKQDPKSKLLEWKSYPLGLMPENEEDKRVWFQDVMEWVVQGDSQPPVLLSDFTSSALVAYRQKPTLTLYSQKFTDEDTRMIQYESLVKVANMAGIKGKAFFNMHERSKHFGEKLRIREDSIDMEQDFVLFSDPQTDKYFQFFYKMKQKDFYSTTELAQFVKDIFAKKVKPFVRSKRVVKKRKKGDPVNFSGADVYSNIYKAKKEQVILLYHSGNQRSLDVKSAWHRVSRYLHRLMPEVEVGQLDYKYNDVRHRGMKISYKAEFSQPIIYYLSKTNRTHATFFNITKETGSTDWSKLDYQSVINYIERKRVDLDDGENWVDEATKKMRERAAADKKRKEALAKKAKEREEKEAAAREAGQNDVDEVEEAEL